MGRDYLEGGYEYYVKEMRRGLLLRKGFGKEGDVHFTETGELRRAFYEPEVTDTPNAVLKERIKPFKQLLSWSYELINYRIGFCEVCLNLTWLIRDLNKSNHETLYNKSSQIYKDPSYVDMIHVESKFTIIKSGQVDEQIYWIILFDIPG